MQNQPQKPSTELPNPATMQGQTERERRIEQLERKALNLAAMAQELARQLKELKAA
jgi:hypothetical protein